MISIFVLEDEILQQSRIEKIISDIISKRSWKCKGPEIFGKPAQLIDAIAERGSHQLFFLDIEIKGEEKKGLDIAKQIRNKDPHATIVFVTTHSEFMPITFKYKVAALDFIDKALGNERFVERIESAIEYTLEKIGMSVAQDAFKFETSLSQVQVPFNKILYFETSPTVHKVILHTTDERLEFYAGISEIEKSDERLYRCHKSFVVNPDNIEKIDKEQKIVYFNGGENCLVSRVKMKGLKERLQ
ncbi:LytTR family transcriptional regulator DNA-binding domain-containing protein [Streptococcus hyointestinalis]|uniref:Response regulator BlpR n=1 Tax=Streptococcus hyointestinalis TaxID=1337 RepID=A0A380JZW1_9STRE|nr:LytTR family DNA-binding domain-containing protein [Streptococcus hyointestinalis]SUN58079.1 response regulator BlpR [Streptococcus hyointestinalis]